MGQLRIGLLFACLAAWLASAAPAQAVEATLTADAHVNSALPDVNSGAISNLNVGGGYTALLQFDLSVLPSGITATQISHAVLRLYCNRVDAQGQVSLRPVNAAWGEYSVTYATLPSLAAATQSFSVNEAGSYLAIDVTSLVQGWIAAPATNDGLALTANTAKVQFDSKENDLTGHAPTLEITLVSAGPKGDPGPVGATGATGPAGPQGAMGVAGPAGAKGDTGASGPVGATGMQGPQGPQGPQGQQGLQGVAGPAGATGPAGPAGPMGPAGPTGLTGPAGAPGMTFRGSYSPVTNYSLNDVVSYQGASYVSIVTVNYGNTPGLSPTYWSVVAAEGAAGAQGPAGVAGAPGAQGVAGPQGPSGPAGPSGPVGMNFRGPWSSAANYQLSDAITFDGSTYLALASSFGLQPDLYPSAWAALAEKGSAGPTGPTGLAATVSIGTVTTGAAGSIATVTNSGTASAAVLNFTIPRGDTGASGTGGSGTGGSAGMFPASMYHAVSYNSYFYSVSNPNASRTEDDSVLTWVPSGCTATALNVYSRQSNATTVTLRTGPRGSMADTVLSCTAASGASCTATGNVSISSGSFVDFSLSGMNGTAAGVWIGLTCN